MEDKAPRCAVGDSCPEPTLIAGAAAAEGGVAAGDEPGKKKSTEGEAGDLLCSVSL